MTGRSTWACLALSFLVVIAFESGIVSCQDELEATRERRAPFSSWAGKRSSGEDLTSAEMDQVNESKINLIKFQGWKNLNFSKRVNFSIIFKLLYQQSYFHFIGSSIPHFCIKLI
jgi:hypothetical protein